MLGRRIGTRARAFGAASIVGLLVAGWPALASAAPFDLAWSAPEGCPSREEIVDATYARLGESRESRSERPAELFVEGTVVETGDGFVVTLLLTDASGHSVGERVVNIGERACAGILTPTSVVLAMMISVACPPDAQPDQPAGSETTPIPPDQPLPVRRRRATRAPSKPPPPDPVALGAAVVGSTAILPDVGVGLAIHASYFPRSVILLRLEASFEVGGSVHVARGEVDFHLWSVGGRAGLLAAHTKRFDIIPTFGGRVGLLQTRATGVKVPLDDASVVAAIGPGVVGRAKLGPAVTLEAFLDGELVLRRDRYQVMEGDKLHHIHEPNLLGARLGLGLTYDFR